VFAIDLSKPSIPGALLDQCHEVRFNRECTRKKLLEWLSRPPPVTVAMEACSGAHYGVRVVERFEHGALRAGHQTNATEALGVASRQRGLLPPREHRTAGKAIGGADPREHLSDHWTATRPMMRSLFGAVALVIAKGKKAFKRAVVAYLEDTENEIPLVLRMAWMGQWNAYLELEKRLKDVTRTQKRWVSDNAPCQRLRPLDSVGPIHALGLYRSRGEHDSRFKMAGRQRLVLASRPNNTVPATPSPWAGSAKTVQTNDCDRILSTAPDR
jgi:hypothetical protein